MFDKNYRLIPGILHKYEWNNGWKAHRHASKDLNRSSSIQIQKTVINYSDFPIAIIDQLGFQNRFNPIYDPYHKDVHIFHRYDFQTRADVEAMREYLVLAEKNGALADNEFLALMKSEFDSQYYGDYSKNGGITIISFFIDIVIDAQDILNYGVYDPYSNYVIVKYDNSRFVRHPYDSVESAERKYKNLSNDYKGLGLFIEIVDNDNTIGSRYLNAGNHIWQIVPVQNYEKKNGVYFGSIQYIGENQIIDAAFISLEEAEEKISLYRTKEDAETFGDVKSKLQLELANLNEQAKQLAHKRSIEFEEQKTISARAEKDLLETKQRLETMRAENEQAKITYEKEVSSLKARLEEKSLREKDYYESRSNERKDGNEILKIAGVVIASIFTIWLTFQKAK